MIPVDRFEQMSNKHDGLVSLHIHEKAGDNKAAGNSRCFKSVLYSKLTKQKKKKTASMCWQLSKSSINPYSIFANYRKNILYKLLRVRRVYSENT